MKVFSYLLILVAVVAGAIFLTDLWFDKPVSTKRFNQAHKYLNRRIDTLSRNQKIMIDNQKTLYRNQMILRDSISKLYSQLRQLNQKVDSLHREVKMLHYGQTVIYDAITSPQPSKVSQSKFQRLIEFFSGKSN